MRNGRKVPGMNYEAKYFAQCYYYFFAGIPEDQK
jgi:hypothetical protein